MKILGPAVIDTVAFAGCPLLRRVEAEHVNAIGERVFKECTELSYLSMLEVVEIGEGAFAGCEKLYVSLPDTVSSIGSSAFSNILNRCIYIPARATVAEDVFPDYTYLFASANAEILQSDSPYAGYEKLDEYEGTRLMTYEAGDIFETSLAYT